MAAPVSDLPCRSFFIKVRYKKYTKEVQKLSKEGQKQGQPFFRDKNDLQGRSETGAAIFRDKKWGIGRFPH